MRTASEHGLPTMCDSGSAANRKSCTTLNNQRRNALLLTASSGGKASLTGPRIGFDSCNGQKDRSLGTPRIKYPLVSLQDDKDFVGIAISQAVHINARNLEKVV